MKSGRETKHVTIVIEKVVSTDADDDDGDFLNDDDYEDEIYAGTKHVTTVIERGASTVCL